MIDVSIIVPVYNVAEYIERCITSLLNQTKKNIEFIIVDDCSTDNSISIIESMILSHSLKDKFKIIRQNDNKGASEARNTGILNSTGKYLYFLDSDDAITEDCIELLFNAAEDGNCDFAIGDYECIDNEAVMPTFKLSEGSLHSKKEIINAYRKYQMYDMAVNKLTNRSFILENNLFFKKNIIHEDSLWSFALAVYSNSMAAISKKTYLYYVRDNSVSTNILRKDNFYINKSIKSREIIVEEMFNICMRYKKSPYEKDVLKAFLEHKNSLLIGILKTPDAPKTYKYEIYQRILNYRCNTKIYDFIQSVDNIKQFIKHFHSILPTKIGFMYVYSFYKPYNN